MRQLGSMQGEGGPAVLVDFKDIDEELRYLRKLVNEWRATPQIRNLAVKLIQEAGVAPRDKKAQAIAIARWVQDNVYYVHELPERFQTPGETLRLKAGDCDDSTTLIGSLIESIGIPSSLVCMRINGKWAHIFPAAVLPGEGILPLDSTMKTPVGENEGPIVWARSRGKVVSLKMT